MKAIWFFASKFCCFQSVLVVPGKLARKVSTIEAELHTVPHAWTSFHFEQTASVKRLAKFCSDLLVPSKNFMVDSAIDGKEKINYF